MENIFPHIMYIADTEYKYDRNHMYLGGEPPENDSRLACLILQSEKTCLIASFIFINYLF